MTASSPHWPPRVLIAPDSFKGSLEAAAVAAAIATGLHQSWPELPLTLVPLADGGEGTAALWQQAQDANWWTIPAHDPLGRPIGVAVAWHAATGTAVLEVAAVVGGQHLQPHERDPWRLSSRGLGEVLRVLADQPAVQTVWLTLGGTTTVDGGLGLLQGLGVAVLTAAGQPVSPGGEGLGQVAQLDWSGLPPRLRPGHPQPLQLRVAYDVTNPLLGPNGAAPVFGPQKGADSAMVVALSAGLAHWAQVLGRMDLANQLGAGSAGGLGFVSYVLGGQGQAGIEWLLAALNFDQDLAQADLVITGEGCGDRQTAQGKVVSGVLRATQRQQVPVIMLAGSLKPGELDSLTALGVVACFDTVPAAMSVELAIAQAETHLIWTARQLGAVLRLGSNLASPPRT